MHNFIKNRLKQRGAALVEYAVLLSFVCAVGWGFVGSDNGMTGSIGSIINSVERLLGMPGVVNVDSSKWMNFNGKLPEGFKLSGKADEEGKWSWSNIWTNDDGKNFAGSAFLESDAPNSKKASEAAKQLINAMFDEGSFGGVDPVSWAFTEGCGEKTQSLNLYWSNCDWNECAGGKVPIMQMNQEANGRVQYYVAMANVDSKGNLDLWNEAAALKGTVTYVNPQGGTTQITCDQKTAPKNYEGVDTSSHALASSGLAFDNYNDAQKAYYELVAQKQHQGQ